MKYKVLLTRSIKENQKLHDKLAYLGFETISCPLIKYTNLPFQICHDSHQTIIVTSKYAARLVASHITYNDDLNKTYNALTVGKKSANILSKTMHCKILYIASDVQDLIKHLHNHQYENVIYFAGSQITQEINHTIDKKIIYNVDYTQDLSEADLRMLGQKLDYIMIYSFNCAKALFNLITKYYMLDIFKNPKIIAISAKVGNVFKDYSANILVSKSATEESMIKLLMQSVIE